MTEWAESKIIPEPFTGSTGANVLTGDQLNGPINAWTRKISIVLFCYAFNLLNK